MTSTSPKTVVSVRAWPFSIQAGLALGPQDQVVLVGQAEQLPALGAEAVLQLAVPEGAGPVAVEEGDDAVEL
ncbi:MAG: hypothetical protein ACRD0D_15660 [Acidimicrobiales bacterium]